MNEKNTGNDTIYLRKVNLIKFLPSTHSFSTRVSKCAFLLKKAKEPKIRTPISRILPACLWIFEPNLKSSAWSLARIHSDVSLPLAFPCK